MTESGRHPSGHPDELPPAPYRMNALPLISCTLALASVLHAAAPLSGSGTLIQNFNILPSATGVPWSDNSTLPHWYLHRSNPAAATPVALLINDNATATAWAPGLYSLGANGNAERALGSAPTGVLGEFSHVFLIQNTNALPVRITTIGYTVENWKENSTAGIAERIDFSYKKAADETTLTDALAGGFLDENNLDVVIPHSGTAGAVHNPGLNFMVSRAPGNPIVLAAGEFAALRWLNSNESGSDAYLGIDNVSITWAVANCSIEATAQDPVRDTKNTPSPADDTFSFSLPVTGIGSFSLSGWQLAALPSGWSGPINGSYGDTVTYSGVPVSAASVSLVLRDRSDAACTLTVVIQTPPVPAILTNTSGPLEIRFATPAAGSTSFTRSYTDGLTDLGWTSGAPSNGFNGVSTRPGGGDANKYFRLRNFKMPRFQTEAVNVENVTGFDVSIQLAAYTTSSSAFEDVPTAAPTFVASDRIQVLGEASMDGVNWGAVTPNLVDPGQTAASQFTEFRIANPGTGFTADGVTPSTLPAVMPFPATRSLRFTRGNARFVRFVVLGGNDSDSENILFDNLSIALIPPVITVTPGVVLRNNQGDDDPSNDTFSFSIIVNNNQPGREAGWTSSEPGYSGSYSSQVLSFPEYPVSGGARTLVFTDAADPSITLSYTVPVPTGVLTAGAVIPVRDEGVTTDPLDDTWTFSVTVTGVNGGTGYANNRTATTSFYGTETTFGPFPVSAGPQTVIFTDLSNNTWTATATFTPPIRPVMAALFAGGPGTVIYHAVTPVITGWTPGTGQGTFIQNAGGGTVPHVLRSDPVILAPVTGAVRFYADFTAADTSGGTNFEANDTFKIELELTGPGGTEVINLIPPSQDTGDGAASSLANGLPNGVLNGFTGLADTGQGTTAAQDYDANRDRDEFNYPVAGVRAAAGESFSRNFHFTALIPDNITGARVLVAGLNNSLSETFTLGNIIFLPEIAPGDTDGDGASNADEFIAGTASANANDVLRLATFTPTPDSTPVTFSSSFPSKIGRFYRLYHSSNLESWIAEGQSYPGTGNSINLTTLSPGTAARLYYRLSVRLTDSFPTVTP